jgi:hypothetical protein
MVRRSRRPFSTLTQAGWVAPHHVETQPEYKTLGL